MKWMTLCLIMLISLAARSQRSHIDTASMLQISGVIIAEDNLEPLPYTTVWNKSIRKGVISDYYGFYPSFLSRRHPDFQLLWVRKFELYHTGYFSGQSVQHCALDASGHPEHA